MRAAYVTGCELGVGVAMGAGTADDPPPPPQAASPATKTSPAINRVFTLFSSAASPRVYNARLYFQRAVGSYEPLTAS